MADHTAVAHMEATIRSHRYAPYIRDSLAHASTNLSTRERLMLILRYQEGLEGVEIAGLLGVHPSTVSRCLREACENLRNSIFSTLTSKYQLTAAGLLECVADIVENPGYSVLSLLEDWSHAPDELYQGNPVSGDIVVKTNYDGLGRMKQISNPFRPAVLSETVQYTTTGYDLAGRVITVKTETDNAVVSTAYDGPRALVTDQANNQRISKMDGLGRLIEVWEIRSTDATTGTESINFPNHTEVTAGYRTNYTYDALDNLRTTTQRVGLSGSLQTRTFEYDGLKRLTRAINPESGTVDYTYDNNSNLETKLEYARSITTTNEYDALNRVRMRSYSDGTPTVLYKYDGQALPAGAPGTSEFDRGYSTGRLVTVTYGGTSAGNYTGYDRLGRANVSLQQTDLNNYRFTYGYDLASETISESYPSGRTITNSFDIAGRLTNVNGQKTGEPNKTYTSQFSYTAHGAVAAMQLGNGKWEHTTFNNRLQPTEIGLGTSSGGSELLKLEYTYGTTTNNGNIIMQKITAPKTVGGNLILTQTYTYDALNRLLTANEDGSPTWSQTYDYDRFGNRAVRSGSYMPTPRQTPTSNSASDLPNLFNQSNNRIIAILSGESTTQYDYYPGGNLKNMPDKTAGNPADVMTYDAENRQLTFNANVGQYVYDGDGHRVKKIDSTGTTIFVYNASSQLIAEYSSGPPSGSGTSYLTSDHLGSTRVVMKQDGSVSRHDYLPFGEEIGSTIGARGSVSGYGNSDSTRQKFTQKERDNESGLDYFLARYYSSAQGRFTSPDEFRGGPHEFWILGSGDTEKTSTPLRRHNKPSVTQ